MPERPVDCGVIGGGVIGLSIARELAGRGLSVTVLSRGGGRSTSSWAAAGILPPAPLPGHPSAEPAEALTAMSDRLHRRWAEELREETGIDNGLRASGGLHLAADEAAMARLESEASRWRERGGRSVLVDAAGVVGLEPALADAVAAGRIAGGMLLPDEMQIRPPRHLEAVRESCLRRGVILREPTEVVSFETRSGRVESVETPDGRVRAGAWVLAAGAWTQSLAPMLAVSLVTTPIRGQILLLNPGRPVLSRIVNHGLDYLLQRDDGRLLVGSTIEDAGFVADTTPEACLRLRDVVRSLIPSAASAPVERAWAGLRPGSGDGLPFVGRLPAYDNAIVAAGHFRAGIHQAPGTAVLVAELLTGEPPSIDLAAFAPDREVDPSAPGGTADYLARARGGDAAGVRPR